MSSNPAANPAAVLSGTAPALPGSPPAQVAAAQAGPGAPPQPTTVIPGTQIPVPLGSGVEKLQSINPPFRTNSPAWYTPGVWGEMGCAVPQPGRYLQTNNQVIWDFIDVCGRQTFNVYWRYPDRKFTRFPTMDCLFEIYNTLVVGRSRMQAAMIPSGARPLLPTHAVTAPQMFQVYPFPLFGPLGTLQQWLKRAGNMICLMMAEAMQHSDNELSFYLTQDYVNSVYPYIRFLLVDMATKFFGYTFQAGAVPGAPAGTLTPPPSAPTQTPIPVDTFTLSANDWNTYNPSLYSTSVEATSSRPPMGWTPTDLDLEPIRGLPIESVIPYLQQWPDSQLMYSTGGIWNQAGAGTMQAGAAPAGGAQAPTSPSIGTTGGPPNS